MANEPTLVAGRNGWPARSTVSTLDEPVVWLDPEQSVPHYRLTIEDIAAGWANGRPLPETARAGDIW